MAEATGLRRRWMLYALGGGMGHVTRALSLARAAVRRGRKNTPDGTTEICLVTNSPYADDVPISRELGQGHRIEILDPQLNRDDTAALAIRLLQDTRYDVLLVDTFPRGLGGELVDVLPRLACHKVLVHRDLSPKYCDQYGISRFVTQFDRLLVPGESAPFDAFPNAERTAPWLIRDADELLSPDEARKRLAVDSDSLPVVAVIGCGKAAEIEQMRRFAARLEREFASVAVVRFVAPPTLDKQSSGLKTVVAWPFFQLIRGVFVVVGGGGYNSVNEARAVGAHYVGLAWPRLYDRQSRRLNMHETAADFSQARDRVAAAIEAYSPPAPQSMPEFTNGVHDAIKIVESLYEPDAIG